MPVKCPNRFNINCANNRQRRRSPNRVELIQERQSVCSLYVRIVERNQEAPKLTPKIVAVSAHRALIRGRAQGSAERSGGTAVADSAVGWPSILVSSAPEISKN